MPLYLRINPGSQRSGDVLGPYEESRFQRAREYAKNLSQSQQKTVEVFWLCGRRRPMLLAIYVSGAQKYPRNEREEQQLTNVSSCMARPGAPAHSLARTPRKIGPHTFSHHRKLPGRFACPARIVSAPPLQDFQLPQPVADVGAQGQTLRGFGEGLPPLGPPIGYPATFSPYSPPRSAFNLTTAASGTDWPLPLPEE